jgi:dTDP-glucose pyrophosphorylase
MNTITISELQVLANSPIREVVAAIDRSRRLGLALVVDHNGKLVNTLTDGDVRRGILAGLTIDLPANLLLEIKLRTPHPLPVVASHTSSRDEREILMRANAIRQLPVLDDYGRVQSVELIEELLGSGRLPLNAVVMAGGFGKRLHPLTETTPKPLLPVGGRPVMELLVEKLQRSGIHDLHVTTHYRSEQIVAHFGNGSEFGVNINYLNEDNPLGTAGALSLMAKPENDVLVVNADIVTQVNFVAMFDYHRSHNSAMTLGVRAYEHVVPYGVVEISNSRVSTIVEKPLHRWFVNAGMYILSPQIFNYLKKGERLDMPDLITRVLNEGKTVTSFPISEQWIDIGQHHDYARANLEANKSSF